MARKLVGQTPRETPWIQPTLQPLLLQYIYRVLSEETDGRGHEHGVEAVGSTFPRNGGALRTRLRGCRVFWCGS